MKKTSRSQHSSLNELNITPLLDLAFVLLVIFIITTPQMVNHLEMNLPSTQVPPPSDRPPEPPHQILVTASGSISLNGRVLTLGELRASLAALQQQDAERPYVVRGTPDADYQYVVRVLDILQQLDIVKVGLATETGSPVL
ncbi:MAG: biopolymer transporter ExbD [Verrucomicrobiae bacterium]|nr:biopolymer transporter ExbD [Verrucomicrobiae bacterium]